MKNLNSIMATGAAWMMAFKIAERSLSLVSTIILVRLLLPTDFGLVAMAVTIISLLDILSAFGLEMAVIQKQDANRLHFDTAWTFNAIFGIAVAVILVLLAQVTADFYDEPRLEAIIYTLALAKVISSFQNIGIVAFRKELEFNKEFLFMTSRKLVSFFTVISLAFWLRNYWALVIGTVISSLITVAISYRMHPYRPRPSFAAARELFSFSIWLVINQVITFFVKKSSHFIIGKMSGMSALGTFEVSDQISNMPTTELAAPINRAVFPSYSKISHDRKALGKAYIDVLAFLAIFSLPAGIGITAVADPMVKVLLGYNWLAAIPLIQLLAIHGAVTSLLSNTGSVYLAIGRPQIATVIAATRLVILVPLIIYLLSLMGVEGAAWAIMTLTLASTPVHLAVISRVLQLNVLKILSVLWRPLVSSLCMYWCVDASLSFATGDSGLFDDVTRLATGVIAGAVCYTLTLFTLWWFSGHPAGPESVLLEKLRTSINRARRRVFGRT